MWKNKIWKEFLIGSLLLVFITGCTAATPEMPAPEPTPMQISCEEVEGNCIELIFYGDSCVFNGPEQFNSGPVTYIFINESDVPYATNMIRLSEDKTYQDLVDYTGEEPTSKHHPSWSVEILGLWKYVASGNVWTGDLEPGLHAVVCAGRLGIWLGGGFTVVE